MKQRMGEILFLAIVCLCLTACGGKKDKPIDFIYLALGASDASGVGAVPLTEGYVYLIARELDQQIVGVFLVNLGVPGARIDLIKEQVRVARELGTKATLVTIWTGANDLVNGDDPTLFREDLRVVLAILKNDIARTIVVANLPDLTRLSRFQTAPSPSVTAARIESFNRVIAEETSTAGGVLIDVYASPVRDNLVFDVDGFHPDNVGHREIARQFLQRIPVKK